MTLVLNNVQARIASALLYGVDLWEFNWAIVHVLEKIQPKFLQKILASLTCTSVVCVDMMTFLIQEKPWRRSLPFHDVMGIPLPVILVSKSWNLYAHHRTPVFLTLISKTFDLKEPSNSQLRQMLYREDALKNMPFALFIPSSNRRNTT